MILDALDTNGVLFDTCYFRLTEPRENVSTNRNTVDRIADIARVVAEMREPETVEGLLR